MDTDARVVRRDAGLLRQLSEGPAADLDDLEGLSVLGSERGETTTHAWTAEVDRIGDRSRWEGALSRELGEETAARAHPPSVVDVGAAKDVEEPFRS